MKLLELEGMAGIPSPQITHITPFDNIIERDDSENHSEASKELAYIHFMGHYESAYANLPEDRRKEKVIKDIFGRDSDWEPDEVVEKGLEKYKELTESEYIRLLNAARSGANQLIEYFKQLDLQERDKNDKLVHKAKDVIKNISEIGEVVEGMDKLKEQIEKNQAKKNANRAGVETNKYSE